MADDVKRYSLTPCSGYDRECHASMEEDDTGPWVEFYGVTGRLAEAKDTIATLRARLDALAPLVEAAREYGAEVNRKSVTFDIERYNLVQRRLNEEAAKYAALALPAEPSTPSPPPFPIDNPTPLRDAGLDYEGTGDDCTPGFVVCPNCDGQCYIGREVDEDGKRTAQCGVCSGRGEVPATMPRGGYCTHGGVSEVECRHIAANSACTATAADHCPDVPASVPTPLAAICDGCDDGHDTKGAACHGCPVLGLPTDARAGMCAEECGRRK